MKLLRTSIMLLLFISAVGCAPDVAVAPDAGDPSPPSEVDNGPVPDDAVFTETGVWPNGDGTFRTVERPITAGEERRQNAARERQIATGQTERIIVDTTCAPFSLWLFERQDLVGNKICFNGAGSVDLSQYKRAVCGPVGCFYSTWQLSTGSYYAGISGGTLEGDVPGASTPPGLPDAKTSFGISFFPNQHGSFAVAPQAILVLRLWQ